MVQLQASAWRAPDHDDELVQTVFPRTDAATAALAEVRLVAPGDTYLAAELWATFSIRTCRATREHDRLRPKCATRSSVVRNATCSTVVGHPEGDLADGAGARGPRRAANAGGQPGPGPDTPECDRGVWHLVGSMS